MIKKNVCSEKNKKICTYLCAKNKGQERLSDFFLSLFYWSKNGYSWILLELNHLVVVCNRNQVSVLVTVLEPKVFIPKLKLIFSLFFNFSNFSYVFTLLWDKKVFISLKKTHKSSKGAVLI